MKIICPRCKNQVGETVGNLVSIKRGRDRILVTGKDYGLIVTCPRDCGEETSILMTDGKLTSEGLELEKETPNPPKEGEPDGNPTK